jgi:hypothetical protein
MFGRISRPLFHPALALLSVVAALAAFGWSFAAPSYDDLCRDGDRMAAAVDRYRLANGCYPKSLEEVGVVAPECPYTPWRYVCYGRHYRLTVGDYDRDGFVLTYRSVSDEWYLDE